MVEFLVRPSCAPPPFSAFEDSARTRPTAKEMERRRAELKIIVTTGLGSDIDRYVSQSPTLTKQITKLKGERWKIVWSAAGGGAQQHNLNILIYKIIELLLIHNLEPIKQGILLM